MLLTWSECVQAKRRTARNKIEYSCSHLEVMAHTKLLERPKLMEQAMIADRPITSTGFRPITSVA